MRASPILDSSWRGLRTCTPAAPLPPHSPPPAQSRGSERWSHSSEAALRREGRGERAERAEKEARLCCSPASHPSPPAQGQKGLRLWGLFSCTALHSRPVWSPRDTGFGPRARCWYPECKHAFGQLNNTGLILQGFNHGGNYSTSQAFIKRLCLASCCAWWGEGGQGDPPLPLTSGS